MQIGAQLYTLRDYTKTRHDFEVTLSLVHDIGYAGVQLSAVGCMGGDQPEVDAKTAREMLDASGLVCGATHRPWERLRDFCDEEIAFHETLGCTYVAIGGLWPKDYAEYGTFVAEAKVVIDRLARHGIRFGYHNHSHEFVRKPGGTHWYDFLIEAEPSLQLEIDVYWAAHAGVDPARLLNRCAGRIDVIHAKDMEVVQGSGPDYAPVGEGNLDWTSILAACREGGTEWVMVEQDTTRRDPFDCLKSSYDFLADRV